MPENPPIISRSAAKTAGLIRYYTGKPCHKGHVAERYVLGWTCVLCAAEAPRKPKPRKRNHKKEAMLVGEAMYSTGKPCRNGHMAERYTDTGRCSVCFSEHAVRHKSRAMRVYMQNRDEILRKNRRPPRPKAAAKALGLAHYFTGIPCSRGHIDKRRVSDGMCLSCDGIAVKEWMIKNPAKVRATVIRRRAKIRGAGGSHTADQILALHELQKAKCVYCKRSIKKKWHVDHIQPLAKGGSNDISNIQLLCPPCNQRKNAKDPFRFALECGMLL